ncbi:MAG: hypothetical protein WCK35_07930 [Chloroflexota bacterium]
MHAIVWIIDPTVGAHSTLHGPELPPQPVRTPKPLGTFIAGFKASVTSRAKRKLTMTDIWQRNFYEHIARNETEIKHFWNYMDNNPNQWEEDKLYLNALPNEFNQE